MTPAPTLAVKTAEPAAVKTPETVTEVEKTPAPGDDATSASMPNPASAYCEARGYRLGARTDANSGQYSVCVFPDLTECEE